jgi:hypothetical protein
MRVISLAGDGVKSHPARLRRTRTLYESFFTNFLTKEKLIPKKGKRRWVCSLAFFGVQKYCYTD